jgi:hypothetical protein
LVSGREGSQVAGEKKELTFGFQTGVTTGLKKKPKASNAIGS